MLESITKDISFKKISIKLWCLYLVQHMLHQINAPQFYTDLGLQKKMLNPPVTGKIQGLFKAFGCFSSTFQGKINFQGLFKTALYIQVLFKSVRTLTYCYESMFKISKSLNLKEKSNSFQYAYKMLKNKVSNK